MSTTRSTPSASDLTQTTIAAGFGVATLVMALFPLAIPILALTAVVLLPLLLVPLVLGLLATAIALPILGLRRLAGRWSRRSPARSGVRARRSGVPRMPGTPAPGRP